MAALAVGLLGVGLEGCSKCGPGNCTGCCDANGQCQLAAADHCGANGGACSTCISVQQCLAGTCQFAGSNGAGSGSGSTTSSTTAASTAASGSSGASNASGSSSSTTSTNGGSNTTSSGASSGTTGSCDCTICTNSGLVCNASTCTCSVPTSSSSGTSGTTSTNATTGTTSTTATNGTTGTTGTTATTGTTTTGTTGTCNCAALNCGNFGLICDISTCTCVSGTTTTGTTGTNGTTTGTSGGGFCSSLGATPTINNGGIGNPCTPNDTQLPDGGAIPTQGSCTTTGQYCYTLFNNDQPRCWSFCTTANQQGSAGGCPNDSYCYDFGPTASGSDYLSCQPIGAASNAGCPSGYVTLFTPSPDPASLNLCGPPCTQSTDCNGSGSGTNFTCVGGKCHCSNSSTDCAPGATCDSVSGSCYFPCTSNSSCVVTDGGQDLGNCCAQSGSIHFCDGAGVP